jgi:hypothetical protein
VERLKTLKTLMLETDVRKRWLAGASTGFADPSLSRAKKWFLAAAVMLGLVLNPIGMFGLAMLGFPVALWCAFYEFASWREQRAIDESRAAEGREPPIPAWESILVDLTPNRSRRVA